MKQHIRVLVCTALLGLAAGARAEVTALVTVEPTSRQEAFMLSRSVMESSLGQLVSQPVSVTKSEELADAMRATRSGEYDIFIAPAQVAASALMRGYELVGATDTAEQYVLVGRQKLDSVSAMRGARLYLPQQDSIYTYMARGMLNASGLSLKDLVVQHERYPQAGLTALLLGSSDATVVRRRDWEAWNKDYPGLGKVLATSGSVPGGFSVVVKKDLPADTRGKLAKWFTSAATACGLKPVTLKPEATEYKAVAELGLFTPTSLPGAKLVTASEVRQLLAQGAVLVDTRTEKEYKTKRVPQAIFVPYVEKSLKDVAFDASQDNFSGVDKLDKTRPTIFSCNGAECWKSYKASRVATQKGFRQVYWFRGGLPEWEVEGMGVASN
ncbi:rhodanese-like domain-containing protein [Aquabacterium sp. A7-Y]|uniref:rhodanese-like domain-containing protein n=1 Tax=Aquabacterium sp. A7-Y TaxID=1349605 RepID=UPI00223D0F6A|nr:rhodanese-like domain-containing protein [Aquabacterium sp. A7-Y]MCW7539952.1 rhodanese-like domain-containing protein [Aquabacterium sp. A7-Y]